MEITLLKRLAYDLPDSFTDLKEVIKSQVSAVNAHV